MTGDIYLTLLLFWPVAVCTFAVYLYCFIKFCKTPAKSERYTIIKRRLLYTGLVFYVPVFLGLIADIFCAAGFVILLLTVTVSLAAHRDKFASVMSIVGITAVLTTVYLVVKVMIFMSQ